MKLSKYNLASSGWLICHFEHQLLYNVLGDTEMPLSETLKLPEDSFHYKWNKGTRREFTYVMLTEPSYQIIGERG